MFATFILIVSLFTSAVFSAPAEESKIILKEIANRKIVGGEDANIEDYKYQGVLQRDGSFICGCALINNRYVVTAAHCTDGISSASRFTVRLGSSSANSGGVVYGVARIHQNPSYDDRTIDYDVSVLELEEDVEFSDSIGPIDYATQQPSGGAEAVISGYGYLSESGGLPTQLQVARVPIVDLAECRRQLGDDITDRMLCAGYDQGGVDACSVSFLLLLAAIVAEAAEQREQISDEALEMTLNDRRYLMRQLKCALNEAPCDPVGRRLKSLAPLVLRGSCPQCSAKEQKQIQKVLAYIQKNFPKEWNKVLQQYSGSG